MSLLKRTTMSLGSAVSTEHENAEGLEGQAVSCNEDSLTGRNI